MIQKLVRTSALVFACAGMLLAQQAQQAAPAKPAPPKGPAFKSQKELDAFKAIQGAATPDARLKAIDEFTTGFPKSDFVASALQIATLTAQSTNDFEKVMIYGDRTLEADPNNYVVMSVMAGALAQSTREFDLDKEDKLKRANDLAKKAISVLETATKPNPMLTDEQWETGKNDIRAAAYEALGMAFLVRKDYKHAIEEFKTAIDVGATSNPATQIRLASAYGQLKNYNEAIATLDQVLVEPQLSPQIRQIAERERLRLTKLKDTQAKK